MIQVKYPEYVEMQLQELDRRIERIYKEEEPKITRAEVIGNYRDVQRRKQLVYERIKPLLDEKVRLIQNSSYGFIVTRD